MNARGAVTNDESRDKGDRVAVCFAFDEDPIFSLCINRAANAVQQYVSPKVSSTKTRNLIKTRAITDRTIDPLRSIYFSTFSRYKALLSRIRKA